MSPEGSPAGSPYRRAVLKISGEGFVQPGERGIAMDAVVHMAEQTYRAAQHGVQLALVLAGATSSAAPSLPPEFQHPRGHRPYMGMLATVMNALALQDALESLGCQTRVMTAMASTGWPSPTSAAARRHLERALIILAAGTGSPFVTTDTAAAQRAGTEADVP